MSLNICNGCLGRLNDPAPLDTVAALRAAEEGHEDCLAALLSVNAKLSTAVDVVTSLTVLHVAARSGNVKAVQQLVGLGADTNFRNADGLTACEIAALVGAVNVVDFLTDDVSLRDLVRGNRALIEAALTGNADEIPRLGGNVDCEDALGRTPLMLAALHGHVGAVLALLTVGASVDRCNKQDMSTALHKACVGGHSETVSSLLRAGATADKLDKDGWSGIHYSCANSSNVEVVQQLINAGVDPAAPTTDRDHSTALQFAAFYGYSNVLACLLKSSPPDSIEATDRRQRTALHYAAVAGHAACVQQLLAAGATVQNTDVSALHLAVGKGHVEVVRAILDAGVSPELVDSSGLSAAAFAVSKGQPEVAALLGSDPSAAAARADELRALNASQPPQHRSSLTTSKHLSPDLTSVAGVTPGLVRVLGTYGVTDTAGLLAKLVVFERGHQFSGCGRVGDDKVYVAAFVDWLDGLCGNPDRMHSNTIARDLVAKRHTVLPSLCEGDSEDA